MAADSETAAPLSLDRVCVVVTTASASGNGPADEDVSKTLLPSGAQGGVAHGSAAGKSFDDDGGANTCSPADAGKLVMVRETEDIHLIRAAQTGDLAAFEELVRRYELRVYRVALRLLGDPTEAEDATQDALVQAWQALPAFRGESSAATWLYRVVTNRCLNLVQRRRSTEPLSEAHEAPGSEPGQIVETIDAFESLKASIMRLTPEQRASLVLREFEGLTYGEIAAVLDVSLPAVKSRIRRARLELVGMMRSRQ